MDSIVIYSGIFCVFFVLLNTETTHKIHRKYTETIYQAVLPQ